MHAPPFTFIIVIQGISICSKTISVNILLLLWSASFLLSSFLSIIKGPFNSENERSCSYINFVLLVPSLFTIGGSSYRVRHWCIFFKERINLDCNRTFKRSMPKFQGHGRAVVTDQLKAYFALFHVYPNSNWLMPVCLCTKSYYRSSYAYNEY